MNDSLNLKSGEWVEIRSKEEILVTLDKRGQLENLPFMPQMFKYCGQRMKVYKRAHKTCDTVSLTGGRKMANAVHLEGMRCDGAAYGGCQAGCLIFWKEAWLKRPEDARNMRPILGNGERRNVTKKGCTESDVMAGTCESGGGEADERTYICQITQLPKATEHLPMLRVSQYVEDYRSGNVGFADLFGGIFYAGYYRVSTARLGLGPIMRWGYDQFQKMRGGKNGNL